MTTMLMVGVQQERLYQNSSSVNANEVNFVFPKKDKFLTWRNL